MTKKQKILESKLIIQRCIIFCLIIEICLTLYIEWHILFSKKMAVKEYEHINLEYREVPVYDMETAVTTLKKTFNTPHFYKEKDLTDKCLWGYSNALFRVVYITTGLKENQPDDYIVTYAHELVHIKYATTDETFAEYMSIIILYESGVDYFQAIAWNEGVNILKGLRAGGEYDCGAQLIEYFGV